MLCHPTFDKTGHLVSCDAIRQPIPGIYECHASWYTHYHSDSGRCGAQALGAYCKTCFLPFQHPALAWWIWNMRLWMYTILYSHSGGQQQCSAKRAKPRQNSHWIGIYWKCCTPETCPFCIRVIYCPQRSSKLTKEDWLHIPRVVCFQARLCFANCVEF